MGSEGDDRRNAAQRARCSGSGHSGRVAWAGRISLRPCGLTSSGGARRHYCGRGGRAFWLRANEPASLNSPPRREWALRARKNLPRFLLEHTHRADVRDRSVADARNAELGEVLVRWHAVHDHDVDRQRYAIADPTDQRIVSQAGNEEAGSARGCVCLGPVQIFADRLCRVDALAKKQTRACRARDIFSLNDSISLGVVILS